MTSTPSKDTHKLLVTLILAIFTLLVFAQAAKKFTLDELDFPIVAKATSETGTPIYYRGEYRPEHLGLYHPPLYIYALAADIKIFGFSENTVRAFGFTCVLLTAYLVLTLSRKFIPPEDFEAYGAAFLSLFLLNPYTVANATLPDIDSTILPPLITLFILLLFNGKNAAALALVFAVLLWTKLTTPLALIPFAFLYWLALREPFGRVLWRTACVFGGGGIIFLLTYFIYCESLDLPFAYTFGFLLHSFVKGSASTGFFALMARVWENLGYAKNLVLAITSELTFLFAASLFFFSSRASALYERRNIAFLLFFSAAVTIFYCSLIAPFGGFFKYPFAVFQFFCMGAALIFLESIKRFRGSRIQQATPILIFIIILFFSLLQMRYGRDNSSPVTYIHVSKTVLIIIGAIIAIAFALSPRNSGLGKFAAVMMLIVFAATIGSGATIARYQAQAPFPTKYSYGQTGMDETVAYLKANLKEGEVIWSMKDIGFYSGNRYIENYDTFFNPEPKEKIEHMVKSGVRFFVATQGIGEDRIDAYPEVRAALESCCRLDKNFGNFYIYVPR